MNLNTKTRSSTLYANARTVLDLISLNFQRQPKKAPQTSSFREGVVLVAKWWLVRSKPVWPPQSGAASGSACLRFSIQQGVRSESVKTEAGRRYLDSPYSTLPSPSLADY